MIQDIIITDKENVKKCSIHPLIYREDLKFIHSRRLDSLEPWENVLFLHTEGEPLSEKDANRPLLLLDASWKRAYKVANHPIFSNLEKRSLPGWFTSYPRVSKLYEMPHGGLASVEALFVARLIQGRAEIDLLKHYYWKEQFLEINKENIQRYS
ncbi:MAG: DUF367 domain-containing protein [Planctomycetes bacterium]|jgi:pre-rRNA-processing protein TSR3|nr:DUF367 domain-containing protein [Planctomycetota bacterium]HON44018.1 DUF367 domain-containing protein [Planctomycetota bacterium]HRU52183.1 DUF367 domain-containing protein [Planctomycetota bacterium]